MAALKDIDIPNVDWQVHAAAATILRSVGRLEEAEAYRARAIEMCQRVAATLVNEPALQVSLLRQLERQIIP